MATFARSTFAHGNYAAFRPSYPPVLFRTVLSYHNAHRQPSNSGTLLDLGCGHGLISRELAPSFGMVHAVDPAAGMIAEAQRMTSEPNISLRQGGAEDLRFLDDQSVDLAVAGQAAHWFDYKKAWPELARVVKRGGTLQFWGYKDHIIVGHPEPRVIFDKFTYGHAEVRPGVESMGRFWETVGRNILRDSYRAIVPPTELWEDVKRVEFDPDRETADVSSAPEEVLWQRKALKLGALEGYIRTYSAFSNWKAAYPQLRSRADQGDGDIVDFLFDDVLEAVPAWKAKGDSWRDVEVDVVWGTCLLQARRR